jgi:DNA-directed RNA polymerase specialized sigma subunit
VLANVRVATSIAARYRNSGEPMEELAQTAYLGLVKAANGFVPERGSDFLAYAVPTIAGEVKRYFRDQGWAVRPPRRVQELHLAMSRVRPELEGRLGRSATVAELAAELGLTKRTSSRHWPVNRATGRCRSTRRHRQVRAANWSPTRCRLRRTQALSRISLRFW